MDGSVMGKFLAFGEILLRLSPPGRELILQTPRFDLWIAGAEANVATALARLGHDVGLVSAVPANDLGDAAISSLKGHGIDTAPIHRSGERMGPYFVTSGAGMRPPEVIYDRAHSSFAEAPVDLWDWGRLLEGVDRLHLSGITPALGPVPAQAAMDAAEAAAKRGIPVSFDGNWRGKLWERWDGRPREILRRIVRRADLLFGTHPTIPLFLTAPFSAHPQQPPPQ